MLLCVGDRRATWAVLTDEGNPRLRDPLTGPQLEGLVHGLRALRDALHPTAESGART